MTPFCCTYDYVPYFICLRKRRKKRIRRIIDDTELGEETKMKIAIEKVYFIKQYNSCNSLLTVLMNVQERQDRLNSLKAQFSSKSKLASSVGFSVDVSESCAADVLGDALTGYIVNVVREEGEEAVRIPPSISSKLKVHQVVCVCVILQYSWIMLQSLI